MSTPLEFAGKMAAFGAGLVAIEEVGTRAAVQAGKGTILAGLAGRGGFKVNGQPRSLGVKTTVVREGQGLVGTIGAASVGMWAMAEKGTRTHGVRPDSDAEALSGPGLSHPVRGKVRGRRPKRVWGTAKPLIYSAAPKVYRLAITGHMAKLFGA